VITLGGWLFLIAWLFVVVLALIDVFRRADLSGGAKAGWAILIVVLPLLGVIVYAFARPRVVDYKGRSEVDAKQAADEAEAVRREQQAHEDAQTADQPDRLDFQ
jgi:hypothetical protein